MERCQPVTAVIMNTSPNPTSMPSRIAALVGVLTLVSVGCHERREDVPVSAPLQVLRVTPAATEPLFLNQQITVQFNRAIDRLSVSPETFRIVTEAGRRVEGRVEVGSHTVTFVPRAPLEPSLVDGSFRPGGAIELRVAGWPGTDTVRALDGAPLKTSLARAFRITSVADLGSEYPSPLLPPAGEFFWPAPTELDRLIGVEDLRCAMHFTLPVLPTTVTPEAFDVRLFRFRGPEEGVQLAPRSVRLLSRPRPLDEHPGSTVELTFDPESTLADGGRHTMAAGDFLSIRPRIDPRGVTDYGGRPVRLLVDTLLCTIVAGDRSVVLAFPPSVGQAAAMLRTDPQADVGFEWAGDREQIRPRVRMEAGRGSLGRFAPMSNQTLRPGGSCILADGSVVTLPTSGDFEFESFVVPSGVEITVESMTPVVVRAVGKIEISGTLTAETPLLSRFEPPIVVEASYLLERAGLGLLAGGSLRVAGTLRHARPNPADPYTSIACLAGGGVHITPSGVVPPFLLLAREPSNGRAGQSPWTGSLERPVSVLVSLTPGLPQGGSLKAGAFTAWMPVSPRALGAGDLVVRMIEASPGLRLDIESVAGRDGRPLTTLRRHAATLDVSPGIDRAQSDQSLEVPFPVFPGEFVRFRFRADVVGGETLPHVQRVELRSR